MSLKIYHYPKCSSCREALKFLKKNQVPVEECDISTKTPTLSELKLMLSFYEGNLGKLFNVSGQKYRELGLKDKLGNMTVEAALKLLGSDGMLIKRPFLIGDGFGVVGFKKEDWEKKFASTSRK